MNMIERLADKWETSEGERWAKDEARWWLNAIADELDGPLRPMITWSGWDSAIGTLRAQAKGESDD